MSSSSTRPLKSETPLTQRVATETRHVSSAIAWSSFLFALLQSVCTFFAALDGLRLAIGITSLAVASGVGGFLDRLHVDWIRLPMIALALFGSLLNLVVLWQIHRLRSRPAAKWRHQPISSRRMWMERVQLVLSIVTLVLIAAEEYWHFVGHHRL